jgi:hypothetical protein
VGGGGGGVVLAPRTPHCPLGGRPPPPGGPPAANVRSQRCECDGSAEPVSGGVDACPRPVSNVLAFGTINGRARRRDLPGPLNELRPPEEIRPLCRTQRTLTRPTRRVLITRPLSEGSSKVYVVNSDTRADTRQSCARSLVAGARQPRLLLQERGRGPRLDAPLAKRPVIPARFHQVL